MPTHLDFGLLIPLLLTLIGGIWGVCLWRNPQMYNPDSFIYRQLYLWYAVWFNKEVDEAYLLDKKEIRRAATLIIVIAIVTIILAVLVTILR